MPVGVRNELGAQSWRGVTASAAAVGFRRPRPTANGALEIRSVRIRMRQPWRHLPDESERLSTLNPRCRSSVSTARWTHSDSPHWGSRCAVRSASNGAPTSSLSTPSPRRTRSQRTTPFAWCKSLASDSEPRTSSTRQSTRRSPIRRSRMTKRARTPSSSSASTTTATSNSSLPWRRTAAQSRGTRTIRLNCSDRCWVSASRASGAAGDSRLTAERWSAGTSSRRT